MPSADRPDDMRGSAYFPDRPEKRTIPSFPLRDGLPTHFRPADVSGNIFPFRPPLSAAFGHTLGSPSGLRNSRTPTTKDVYPAAPSDRLSGMTVSSFRRSDPNTRPVAARDGGESDGRPRNNRHNDRLSSRKPVAPAHDFPTFRPEAALSEKGRNPDVRKTNSRSADYTLGLEIVHFFEPKC